MAKVLEFQRPPQRKPQLNRARPAPFYVLSNVAALLATVEGLQIQTPEDLRYAIFLLELANICIRLVIRQVESGTARERFLAQSARIDRLIDDARSESAHLSGSKILT